MARPKPFHATVQIPAVLGGQIVTDRIACRRHTCILEEKPEGRYASARKLRYQRRLINVLLAACDQSEVFSQQMVGIEIVRKFLALAQMLKTSEAVAFLSDAIDSEEDHLDASEDEDEDESNTSKFPSPQHAYEQAQLPIKHAEENNLHPLLVALVAFPYGGPVNASFTTHDHEWKLLNDVAKDETGFYSEIAATYSTGFA